MELTPTQQAQVDALKKLIGPTAYSDEQLWIILVSVNESQNGAAARVWTEKMTSTSSLIDIKEGSSSRNLSNLHTNAKGMAAYFSGLAAAETGTTAGRSRTRAIVRPS